MEQSETQIALRPFPHPYKAALAICSDIDNCDWKTFAAVHRFVNDPVNGFGLPTADSFFAWGREPQNLAFYQPDGKTRSMYAGRILDAIESGLIDSIHSWGDFHAIAPEPEFLSGLAGRMTDELASRGLQIKVWINHGDKYNRQNFLARLQQDYEGDDPSSPYFTCDYADSLGVKYYWWSEVLSHPLSAQRPRRVSQFWNVNIVNTLKNGAKKLTGRSHRTIRNAHLIDLAHPVRLRNGRVYLAFTRFNHHPDGPWGQPTRHTFRYSLSRRSIEDLEAQEGYAVVYTHFGQPYGDGVELFPGPDRDALENLAEFYHDGRIWVAPTARLLNYWLASRRLNWRSYWEGERIIIELLNMDDPMGGPRTPEKDELAGLCFYTPRPESTVILLSGKEAPLKIYPPDRTGRACVGFDPPSPPELDVLEK